MPELPEVETVRRTLQQLVVGKTIKETDFYWPKMVKHPDDQETFALRLKGQTIRDIGRRGKFLLFYLDDDVLISHLRMEGKYGLYDHGGVVDQHTHVVFRFQDGSELRYKDVRKFGTFHLYPKGEELLHPPLHKLGPEPFDESFTSDYLYGKCQNTTRVIKNVLLDQSVVTGLGNIYVDEALFRSGIHPLVAGNQLRYEQCETLRTAIINTLSDAIKAGGTTIRSYVNSHGDIGLFQLQLYVYGRKDEYCKVCHSVIHKMKVGGRGTHYCEQCQPIK
ncbi:DNA-formamidopyrimidine glycosylase [Salirhabdus salicampi]|uniref:DNA-formamidopyrimidine glycosylase n=1 Tax=Salirhabdus salicampi TaxID=476102 RepID=UPI0020C3D44A|nr:DNA-formamidopyrimidine glycosylase [Salirhabdus salicampi]MCP8617086.1 DNA-formamidopyrimidine glycosylase [Salirhabdus salicampi]